MARNAESKGHARIYKETILRCIARASFDQELKIGKRKKRKNPFKNIPGRMKYDLAKDHSCLELIDFVQ